MSEETYPDVIELKLKLRFPNAHLIRQVMQTKKYVEIPEEALVRLSEGKSIQGSLQRDIHSGRIVFNPHNLARYKPGYKRPCDRLICMLEHGWVKESTQRIKVHESIPKIIGTARVMTVLDREIKDAKMALIDREIINNV